MYSFLYDYSEGAHPQILDAIIKTNFEQTIGYGLDNHCKNAAALIKKKLCREDVDIHFFMGGTQTNMTAIAAFLKPYQAVISAETGHINVHETGAIEATGHKVTWAPTPDGKLTTDNIESILARHGNDEHMVMPKLVYISNSTEIGSIYTKSDLIKLSKTCKENNLLLYMDGARLGSALMSTENDLTLADITNLVDAFYIGGTKNGALMGEALVICREELKEDFRYHIKQRGGLLAKGRLLGIQFEEFFRDDLYFKLSAHANEMAAILIEGIKTTGYSFLTHSASNQVFPILPNSLIKKLEQDYSFYIWEEINQGESAIRLVTSWATEEKYVRQFVADLKSLSGEI